MRLYMDSHLSRLIYCGDFERGERQFLNAFLKQGDTFVDVGANTGLYTVIAARRVGKSGRVLAFEPCREPHRRLLANVELNHLTDVSCHQLALSDVAGEARINISLDGFDAFNSFAQPIKGNLFAAETVNCARWDDFAEEHDLVGRVTMMKIDVEGWESHVLAGGHETLSRRDAPTLQVEFTDRACEGAGSSCHALYHALEELGYQMYVYDGWSRRLIHDPIRASYPYLNLIATKTPEPTADRVSKRSILRWCQWPRCWGHD